MELSHEFDFELLENTPMRVVRAWEEFAVGYKSNPRDLLRTGFLAQKYDEMIYLAHIPVVSTCEHHILPIVGEAFFAYIPNGKIVGLSKIPRFIDILARRLQVQERLTSEIVDTFMCTVEPLGCGCRVVARHDCMECRGVRVAGVDTGTTALRGCFKSNDLTRDEFLELMNAQSIR